MAANTASDLALRLFYRELGKLHLRPVKKMNFQFDPFRQDVNSIRDFLYHVSAKRKRKTNLQCMIKAEVVNDRSEPRFDVFLDNGKTVTFKTANLSALEIAEEFNTIVNRFDIPPEEPTTKLKGAFKKKK